MIDITIDILIEDLGDGAPPENASIKGISIVPAGAGPVGASLKPGDTNGDGAANISDPVALLNFLFAGGELTECYRDGEALSSPSCRKR